MVKLGILLIIAQQVLFTLETAAVHQLSGAVSVVQLCLVRAIGGLGLVAVLGYRLDRTIWRTSQIKLQVARAAVTIGYALVMMYSYTRMPFSDATAISYTQVIYVALFAYPILRERVAPRQWWGVVIGFCGALLLVRPGFSQVSWVYLFVLLGTSLNALALVLTRYMQRQDEALTVMFYLNLISAGFFAPATIFDSYPISSSWVWLIAVLALGPIGQYAGIVAVRHAEASLLAPYTYTRLILSGLLAAVVFREPVDVLTILGSAVIVLACVLASLDAGSANGPVPAFGWLRRKNDGREST